MTIPEIIETVRSWMLWPPSQEHSIALCDEVDRLTKALTELSAHHNLCIKNHVNRENALRAELEIFKSPEGNPFNCGHATRFVWTDPAGQQACCACQLFAAEQLRVELAELKSWKKQMLIVEQWWSEVEDCIRNRSDGIMGDSVSGTALRLIKERDELQLRLFKALNPIVFQGRGNNSQGEG